MQLTEAGLISLVNAVGTTGAMLIGATAAGWVMVIGAKKKAQLSQPGEGTVTDQELKNAHDQLRTEFSNLQTQVTNIALATPPIPTVVQAKDG